MATPQNQNKSSTFDDLNKGLNNLIKIVTNIILDVFDIVVEPFFKINATGRLVRTLVVIIAIIIWGITSYIAHPPQIIGVAPWISFPPADNVSTRLMFASLEALQIMLRSIVNLIAPFFAPDIFRHVLVFWLACWIAYQWAAIYLDDIFELGDDEISRRFIRTAAFNLREQTVQIADGEVMARFKNSPIIKIGGPGRVQVHMENAALFEKINGEPHVILPEDKFVTLEGFERLRAVIDLRDQFIDGQNISGRTKDGITVTAKNVNVVFSIHRGEKPTGENSKPVGQNGKMHGDPTAVPKKFYYDRKALEEAIKHLVYNQVNRSWDKTAINNIQPDVKRWIGAHTLDEFLANVSPQELAEFRQRAQTQGTQNPLPLTQSAYLPRTDITNAVVSGAARGYDVHWIGVGTWETPQPIPERHYEALQISVQNRMQGSELELARLQRKSRLEELVRLLQDLPISTFANLQTQEDDPQKIKHGLLVAYREKLKNARDWYRRNNQPVPNELAATIRHLSQIPPP